VCETVPTRVKREAEAFLRCGDVRYGFVEVSCENCHASRLVAFCCKGRGWCPSCTNRRAVETGVRLAALLPQVRHRQWTLSIPFSFRFVVVKRPALLKRLEYRLVASVVGIGADTVLFRQGRDLWVYARPYADERLLGSFLPPFQNEPRPTSRGVPLAVFPEKRGNFLVQWNRDAGVPVLTWLPFGSAIWASGQFVAFEVDAGVVRFVDYRR
jgi:hypothetical protein